MEQRDDHDTPWKDALTRYFPEFIAFYFPAAYDQIDWQRPHAFLEQELAQVVRDADLGKRRVDKLVRVAKHGGADEWVFVHIDVQGGFDKSFAERIFVYNYRIYDRYRRPVASLALLADGRVRWRPASFEYRLFGCEVGIRFPTVKLSDYTSQLNELLCHSNVFGLVTAAHLLTQQTRGRHVQRHEAKWRLARMLYDRSWDRQRIIDLFNIIDWMMRIPEHLQIRLMRDITELERIRAMPYVSSFQRLGREEGREEGRQEGRQALQELVQDQLQERFGPLPQPVKDRLAKGTFQQLQVWGRAVLSAPTLDKVFSSR